MNENDVSMKKHNMNQVAHDKLVPKLRFPNFKDEWHISKLGSISDVTKLAGFEFTKYVNYENTGNIIAIRGLNIKNNKLNLEDIKYIDNSDFTKLKRSKLYSGDLLFTYVGTIGEVAIIDEEDKYYLAPNVCRIRVNKNINSEFLKFYFNTHFIKKEIKKYVTKSSQPSLSMENIRKFKVGVPNLYEQNKISNFLSVIDKKIELLEQKQFSLKIFKKGFFNNYIANIKNSVDTGIENVKIHDLISILNVRNKNNDDLQVLSVNNKKGFIAQEDQFEDRSVASTDKSNYKIVEKGDFAYNPARINVGSIARLKKYNKGIVSPMYIVFRIKNKNYLNPIFLENYIKSNYFNVEVKKRLEGSVRLILSANSLVNINLFLPSIKKQIHIAEFLDKLDQMINLNEREIINLKLYKKELLNRMFV